MYTVHATAKLLTRVKQRPQEPVAAATALGNWYATVMSWRPQVALLVNELTLLPVFMHLAPAAKLLDRFPAQLGAVLTRLGAPPALIETEQVAMINPHWAKTANRSVVGTMTEFAFLADHHRGRHATAQPDLVELSIRLSHTPCSPLYKTHTSPDRAVEAAIEGVMRDRDLD